MIHKKRIYAFGAAVAFGLLTGAGAAAIGGYMGVTLAGTALAAKMTVGLLAAGLLYAMTQAAFDRYLAYTKEHGLPQGRAPALSAAILSGALTSVWLADVLPPPGTRTWRAPVDVPLRISFLGQCQNMSVEKTSIGATLVLPKECRLVGDPHSAFNK